LAFFLNLTLVKSPILPIIHLHKPIESALAYMNMSLPAQANLNIIAASLDEVSNSISQKGFYTKINIFFRLTYAIQAIFFLTKNTKGIFMR
jgi:hypothetical protein